MMRVMLALLMVLGVPLPLWADYDLGLVAFERGDFVSAEREFSALAGDGHVGAQYSLAMLYLKSRPPQYARAIPWLEKSARVGLPESQYMLGMLTLYGVGTAKNPEQGMRWLQRARDQDNQDARALLDELKRVQVREAASARRKSEQARRQRAELDRAAAGERALEQRLEQSRQREKALASERQRLEQARARDTQEKNSLLRKQTRLQAELAALRRALAKAESERATPPAAQRSVNVTQAKRSKAPLENVVAEGVVAGRVVEILPDGVLLSDVSRTVNGRSEPVPDGFVVFLDVAADTDFSEGQAVAYPAEPATPYRYKYASGATGRIRAFRVVGQ